MDMNTEQTTAPANRTCDECDATWPENHAWNCSREELDIWN